MFTAPPELIPEIDRMACERLDFDVKTLMRNAAMSIFNRLVAKITKNDKIVILCGKGNNAGDGYCLAYELEKNSYDVTVINVFSALPRSVEAKFYYDECVKGTEVVEYGQRRKYAADCIESADHIVEAVFGTGFNGGAAYPADEVFRLANSSSAKRYAVDIPGGIKPADGTVCGEVFNADYTYTFAIGKDGMYSYPARKYAGEIFVEDIGIPYEMIIKNFDLKCYFTDEEYLRTVIKSRTVDSHKGDYGRLLVFSGSMDMPGAAALCLDGALRTGVGIGILASERAVVEKVQNKMNEPIYLPLDVENGIYGRLAFDLLKKAAHKANACLMGCGLGERARDKSIIYNIIEEFEIPLVIDADAVNALEGRPDMLLRAKRIPVITPHPLEFSRLSGIPLKDVQSNRLNVAMDFAKRYKAATVLKGAATVIALPDGRVFINSTGNPGLAKGGSGDVLSGMIASFAAQGYSAEESAVCAVYLHGKAGDALKEKISESGFIPSELPMEAALQLAFRS